MTDDKHPQVQDLLARGSELRLKDKDQEALALFREAVDLAPTCGEAWLELGTTLSDLDRDQESEDAFDEALVLMADRPGRVWMARGHAQNNACRYEEALESFEHLIEVVPDWPPAWNFKAMVLGNLGAFCDRAYYEDQLAATEHVLALFPDKIEERMALEMKGQALDGLGRAEEARIFRELGQRMFEEERRRGLWQQSTDTLN
jgi:tetratricopeptide (TPR) repeat protein